MAKWIQFCPVAGYGYSDHTSSWAWCTKCITTHCQKQNLITKQHGSTISWTSFQFGDWTLYLIWAKTDSIQSWSLCWVDQDNQNSIELAFKTEWLHGRIFGEGEAAISWRLLPPLYFLNFSNDWWGCCLPPRKGFTSTQLPPFGLCWEVVDQWFL